jgi:pimeloyl-ACP methyl ester carboxylesterase
VRDLLGEPEAPTSDQAATKDEISNTSSSLPWIYAIGALVAFSMLIYTLLPNNQVVDSNRQLGQSTISSAEIIDQALNFASRDRYFDAWLLVRDGLDKNPDHEALHAAMEEVTIPAALFTEPEGVQVSFRPYGGDEWFSLGETPLEDQRLPRGMYQWRFELAGHQTSVLAFPNPYPALLNSTGYPLYQGGDMPGVAAYVRAIDERPTIELVPATEDTNEIRVQAGVYYSGLQNRHVSLPTFWIGKFEVTNAEFAEFVDAGGYEQETFWRGLSERPWQEIVADCKDETGRSGPSTWRLGTYLPGQGSYPVGGVSWYEAAAYARFRNRQLPTMHHWGKAALSIDERASATVPTLIKFANILSGGPVPVGSSGAISTSGAHDMAGNVREWVLNPSLADKDLRLLRGSSWLGNPWMVIGFEPAPALDRSPNNGIRLARYPEDTELEGPTLAGLDRNSRDLKEIPVPDREVLDLLLDELAYAPGPVDVEVVEESEDDPRWRSERITLKSGRGSERFEVLLLIPYRAQPPWQAVVYAPGAGALFERRVTGADAATDPRFVVTGGRVLIYPEWFGTFSRQIPGQHERGPQKRELTRELTLQQRQELGRILDFVASREDLDNQRVAFMAASQGGYMVPIIATESRLRALVLQSWAPDSFKRSWHPVADAYTLASRIKLPTLLIAGRQDPYYRVDEQQLPFLNRLATPSDQIHHVTFDGVGHAPLPPAATQREVTDFLDKYLGEVTWL